VTAPDKRLTRTGAQLGTPHFMAPEQVRDSKRADPRADLYAVAVTLFAMLSGERPYGPIAVGDWVATIAKQTPPRPVWSPLEELPPALVEAVAIGLSVDPARRFQDAGAFARALLDSVPTASTATRALPALAATVTFNTRIANRGATAAVRRRSIVVFGALAAMFALGVIIAAVIALVALQKYDVASLSTLAGPGRSPDASDSRLTTIPVGAPLPTPAGLGVHFRMPVSYSDQRLELQSVTAMLQGSRADYESCRVLGRATHASIAIGVAAGTGEPVGWQPNPFEANDREASMCIGARFANASRGVRFGQGHGIGPVVISADLDAR
jgi:hypothetical protein